MKYKNTIDNLEKWIKIVHQSIYIVAGIEVLIVIIIGVASSNIYHKEYSSFWISILISLSLLFFAITILKIAYNKNFPISIIEELKSKKKLDIAKNSLERKNAVNDYIANTINNLSGCQYRLEVTDAIEDWKDISDKDLTENLKLLTKNFNNALNILLNTSNAKFSTGIYLKDLRAIDDRNKALSNSGTFLLRDDYKLKEFGDQFRNIMDLDAAGIDLEIQDAIKNSLNNRKYFEKRFKGKNNEILMICSNIYDLKNEDYQEGVLFIITNNIKKIPEDIEAVLRIFSNIISHWIDLYEHEIKDVQLKRLLETMNDEDNLISEVESSSNIEKEEVSAN